MTAPPNGNIAPPGYYMLFLVNSSGVPSVAKFIQLVATGSQPGADGERDLADVGNDGGWDGVTVTGTGFLAGATVTLGGTAATSVTVVNSTSITATTAAHAAGAVNVVVTNTDGQSGTLTNGYTYTASNPAPTVSASLADVGNDGGRDGGDGHGDGLPGGSDGEAGRNGGERDVTVVNSTTITATTAAHAAGAVNVVVTNTDAQTGTLTNGYTYTRRAAGGAIGFVQVSAATPIESQFAGVGDVSVGADGGEPEHRGGGVE